MRTLSIRTPSGLAYVAGFRIVSGVCVSVALTGDVDRAIPVGTRFRHAVTCALGSNVRKSIKGAR